MQVHLNLALQIKCQIKLDGVGAFFGGHKEPGLGGGGRG